MESTHRRVKAYQLVEDWVDLGTGQVDIKHSEAQGCWKIVVISETSRDIILETKVSRDDIYQRQQDSLIVWSEPETGQDLSLSFQEPAGCSEFWELILHTQRNYALESSADELQFEFQPPLQFSDVEVELPPANINNIDTIEELICGPLVPSKIGLAVLKSGYIEKLLDLFSVCEDLESEPHLVKMFNIFKSILMWNKPPLIEEVTSQKHILRFIGVFEHDPDLPLQHRQHRKFLEKDAKFQLVIPFPPEIIASIHQAYRLQYLKDIILSRIVDDPTFATFNSLAFFLNLKIIRDILNVPDLMENIFAKLREPASPENLLRTLQFLQELTTTARNLPALKSEYFNGLISNGLFEILVKLFGHQRTEIRLAGAEIMNGVLAFDPSLLRRYFLSHKNDNILAELMINRFLMDPDEGMRSQMLEMLRALIDSDAILPAKEKEDFMSLFYSDLVHKFIIPFKEGFNDPSGWVRYNVVELLTTCVRVHSFRIRYFLLGQAVIEKLVKLVSSPLKFLAISVIRFMKAIVTENDSFYQRHLAKFRLLDPIVDVFLKQKDQYNLLNSTAIDLFEVIRVANLRPLVESLVTKYEEQFAQIKYVPTFENLIVRFHQNQETVPTTNPVTTPSPSLQSLPSDRRGIIDEEDKWFEEEEPPQPLVPYPDDPPATTEFREMKKRSSEEEDGLTLREVKKQKQQQ